jgi:hypothetical protein
MFRSEEWRFTFGALRLRMGLRVIVLEEATEVLPPLSARLSVGEVASTGSVVGEIAGGASSVVSDKESERGKTG